MPLAVGDWPEREIAAATCTRDRRPSFWKTRVRCVSIVFSLRKSRAAISRFVSPSATSCAISRSRRLSPGKTHGARCPRAATSNAHAGRAQLEAGLVGQAGGAARRGLRDRSGQQRDPASGSAARSARPATSRSRAPPRALHRRRRPPPRPRARVRRRAAHRRRPARPAPAPGRRHVRPPSRSRARARRHARHARGRRAGRRARGRSPRGGATSGRPSRGPCRSPSDEPPRLNPFRNRSGRRTYNRR